MGHLRIHSAATPGFDPVVITGIGMLTSVGNDRETVWDSIQNGRCGVQRVADRPDVPEFLNLAAPVDIEPGTPHQLKVVRMGERAAAEALADANIDLDAVDRDRFACAVSAHMGDWRLIRERLGGPSANAAGTEPFLNQWLPNSSCWNIATKYGLNGPRICHSTACASGLIEILSAVRAIQDDQADIALAGSAEGIDRLFAAGFKKMRVLSDGDDPNQACRPFHRDRNGFVMGEGSAMFVIERLSHALARNATIYAEIASGKMLADAQHVTGLDTDSSALTRLIDDSLRQASITANDVGYINAHGTGTQQNDVFESRGIRAAFGNQADSVCVSSTKSMLGHLVNAAGSVELAVTTLALRDGFVPPTLNLSDQDPACDLDCLPMVGREKRTQHALKLSIAFGGHLVAVALRRWNATDSGFAYPTPTRRAA